MSLKFRRGTDLARSTMLFDDGEPVWTTGLESDGGKKLYIGDGTTGGGVLVNPPFPDIPVITPNIAAPDSNLTVTGPQTNALNVGYDNALFDLVYLDSTGVWNEADATATSTSINMLGLALTVPGNGNRLNVSLPGSFIRDDSWTWTIGLPLYISTTSGVVTQTAPTGSMSVVRTIGYALSADIIFFQPSSDYFVVV